MNTITDINQYLTTRRRPVGNCSSCDSPAGMFASPLTGETICAYCLGWHSDITGNGSLVPPDVIDRKKAERRAT